MHQDLEILTEFNQEMVIFLDFGLSQRFVVAKKILMNLS